MEPQLAAHPLDTSRFPDLVTLFGPRAEACYGCWCMSPRLRRVDFEALSREDRRASFEALVKAGPPPGILAYSGADPVGWVAVAPRRLTSRFETARNSAPPEGTDPDKVWAITCFVVGRGRRGKGLMAPLTRLAIAHAQASGALALDVCPIEPDKPLTWGEGYVGIASVMQAEGFVEIARRSPKRPLMRLEFAR